MPVVPTSPLATKRLHSSSTPVWPSKLVSLKWDSALEAVYRRLHGTSLPPGILAEPRSNVAHPDELWVLPHQDGVVSPDIVEKVNSLAEEHPKKLLVVGLCESDPTVVQETHCAARRAVASDPGQPAGFA
jgi:hypothetical protein